jgi:hypothetical protein
MRFSFNLDFTGFFFLFICICIAILGVLGVITGLMLHLSARSSGPGWGSMANSIAKAALIPLAIGIVGCISYTVIKEGWPSLSTRSLRGSLDVLALPIAGLTLGMMAVLMYRSVQRYRKHLTSGTDAT